MGKFSASNLWLSLAKILGLQGGMYSGLGYIGIIVLFSFAYNIVKFFELKTVNVVREEVYDNVTIR